MHGFAIALLLDRSILKSIGKAYALFDLFGEIGGLVEFHYVNVQPLSKALLRVLLLHHLSKRVASLVSIEVIVDWALICTEALKFEHFELCSNRNKDVYREVHGEDSNDYVA